MAASARKRHALTSATRTPTSFASACGRRSARAFAHWKLSLSTVACLTSSLSARLLPSIEDARLLRRLLRPLSVSPAFCTPSTVALTTPCTNAPALKLEEERVRPPSGATSVAAPTEKRDVRFAPELSTSGTDGGGAARAAGGG